MVSNFKAYPTATKVAVQHPFGGDVSVQLPVPKAPLFRRSRALAVNHALRPHAALRTTEEGRRPTQVRLRPASARQGRRERVWLLTPLRALPALRTRHG